jgi:hypothetical protein
MDPSAFEPELPRLGVVAGRSKSRIPHKSRVFVPGGEIVVPPGLGDRFVVVRVVPPRPMSSVRLTWQLHAAVRRPRPQMAAPATAHRARLPQSTLRALRSCRRTGRAAGPLHGAADPETPGCGDQIADTAASAEARAPPAVGTGAPHQDDLGQCSRPPRGTAPWPSALTAPAQARPVPAARLPRPTPHPGRARARP